MGLTHWQLDTRDKELYSHVKLVIKNLLSLTCFFFYYKKWIMRTKPYLTHNKKAALINQHISL